MASMRQLLSQVLLLLIYQLYMGISGRGNYNINDINTSRRKFIYEGKEWEHCEVSNRLHAASHLVELQQQDQARPAGVIEGQQEDAEHPGRTADQGRDHVPQAPRLIMQHTVSRPVWTKTESAAMCSLCKCKAAPESLHHTSCHSHTRQP